MADTPSERPCGETPRGSHGSHRYMIDGALYQCPGGDMRELSAEPVKLGVKHLIPVVVALERRQRAGKHHPLLMPPLPTCPRCGTPPIEVIESTGHPMSFEARLLFKPCGHAFTATEDIAYEAAQEARSLVDDEENRPASEREDEGHAEPAPPQTVAEQVRDLERIIERVREAVGTDMTLVGCEQHETRLAEVTQESENLRGWAEALQVRLRETKAAYRDALGLDNDEAIDALAAARDMRRDLADAQSWARHGYEIGQRHCGWSDHGVAPAWLTEGWPPHIDSCEHATRAAEYDTTLSRVRTLASKRLDEDECSPQERSGYHDAMRMVLALMDDNYDGRTVEPDGEDE